MPLDTLHVTLDLLPASRVAFSVAYERSAEDGHGCTGHVQDLRPGGVGDAGTSHFYICSVPEMVVEPKKLLSDLKEAEGQVFAEGREEGAVAE